jgi:hypothetical protein
MENEELISIYDFCQKSNIDETFVYHLRQSELIEITIIEEKAYIHTDQLLRLERLARFHYDLEINLEGIEVIDQLLRRIENMQQEINTLRNRLQIS